MGYRRAAALIGESEVEMMRVCWEGGEGAGMGEEEGVLCSAMLQSCCDRAVEAKERL